MAVRPLPAALVSLIHHVELNRAGWWEKGVRRLILVVLHNAWLSGENLTPEGVFEGIHTLFNIKIETNQVRDGLKKLLEVDAVIQLPDDHFKVSEKTSAEINKEIEEAEKIEEETKQTFVDLLKSSCPTLDPTQTWESFKENFLLPLVKETGANTYRLVSRGKVEFSRDRLDVFLQTCPKKFHNGLRRTLQSFLNPNHASTRSYILRHLNAFFFLEAGPLSKSTLDDLNSLSKRRATFKIFVDTNFLFSLLELHENPANEAARSVRELIRGLSGRLEVKLYVLTTTIAEIKHAISKEQHALKGLRAMPNMAAAVAEAGLSGITSKFIQEASRLGHPLSPEDFFSPYTQNLLAILEEKGVVLFNEKLDRFKTDQAVIDDIMMQRQWQEQHAKPGKEKTYEQLEHDMILWHFTRSKRPATVESPLDACYWVVTVDYRLIGFDAYKRQLREEEIPICLDPAMLIQMLQFWVPRSEEYESALLNSLRLPYFFREFDPDAEKVTVRILGVLSRYENVGDLQPVSITRIVLNDVLRRKMETEPSVERQIELVKPFLLEIDRQAKVELEAALREKRVLATQVKSKEETISSLREEVSGIRQELSKATSERDLLKQDIDELKSQRLEDLQTVQRRKHIARFALWLGLLFAGTLVPPLAILRLFGTAWENVKWAIASWCIPAIAWVFFAVYWGSRATSIRNWRPYQLLRRFKISLSVALIAVIGTGLAYDVYQWIKSFLVNLFSQP